LEARDGADRVLDRPRDRQLHLLDRRDAVVDADDDPRKVGGREDRHRQRQRLVDADHRQDANQEDDRLRVAGEPVVVGTLVNRGCHQVSSGSSSSLAGAIWTLTFDRTSGSSLNSSKAPVVATRWPLSRPSVTWTLPPSRMPVAILRRCGLSSLSITMAKVAPDGLVSTAAFGPTSASGTVFAIISTRRLDPGRSVPSGLSACTHTSTVVFAASSAGLICVTRAAIGAPSGPIRFA